MSIREMMEDGVNDYEQLGLKRIWCASQFTTPKMAGITADLAGKNTNWWYSKSYQVWCTPHFPPSATTLVSVRNTRVFWTALTALTEPRTLWRRITRYPLHTYLLYCTVMYTHIRTTPVLHASQLCWSRLHNAWQRFCLSPAAASLGMLLVRLEIIATTYSSTIFKTYAFSLYSHLCIYATYLHTVYLDWQHAVIVINSRCAWRWQSSERPPPLPLYLRTPAVAHSRCTWRPWSSELRDALGGPNRANLEIHLEAVIEWDWMSTWRRSMDGAPGAETVFHQLVRSQPWECDKVTLPLSSHWELADGGRSCMEAHRKLKLHSAVNS